MMDHKEDVALLREAVDAWFPKEGPVACAMTITVPDGRVFEFNAIPKAIAPEYGDVLGFELTVQSVQRLERRCHVTAAWQRCLRCRCHNERMMMESGPPRPRPECPPRPTGKTTEAQIEVREQSEARLEAIVRLVRHYIGHMLGCIGASTRSEFARHVTDENSRRVMGWQPDKHEMEDLRRAVQEHAEWGASMGARLRRELKERGTDYAAMQAVVPMCCWEPRLLMGISADGMLITCCKECEAWSFHTGVLPHVGTGVGG